MGVNGHTSRWCPCSVSHEQAARSTFARRLSRQAHDQHIYIPDVLSTVQVNHMSKNCSEALGLFVSERALQSIAQPVWRVHADGAHVEVLQL